MSWQVLSPMPAHTLLPIPIELNSSIYVVNGFERNPSPVSNVSTFWCYDPIRDQWTQKAGLNTDNKFSKIFKMNQNIWTFNKGGSFKMYDSAMDSWKTVI